MISPNLVSINLMVPRKELVPDGIPVKGPETPEELQKRQNRKSKNKPLFENIKEVSLILFFSVLLSHDFVVTKAWFQERIHGDGNGSYFIIRFELAHKDEAILSEDFLKTQDQLKDCLRQMINMSFWKIRVYINPLFLEGKKVPGRFTISIDAAERFPRFEGDNEAKPIMVWQRDAVGNKLMDRDKIQIPPKAELHYNSKSGQLTVVAVNGSAM